MKKIRNAYKHVTHHPADHWLGYFVAFSGALMQMMSYGIDNSFSIFSNSMQNDPTLGYPSATTVSFGNSVSLGLSPVFGLLAGILVDHVPPRIMMFFSTVVLFAGLWISSTYAMSSIAVTFSYCLLASISSALMLSPGAAATSSWFRRRLGLAQGINFCGGGIGSAFIPAVLGSWVEPYGWRKTFQLMSCFCSIGLVGTLLSCRRHRVEDDYDDADEMTEDLAPVNAREAAEEPIAPSQPSDELHLSSPDEENNAAPEDAVAEAATHRTCTQSVLTDAASPVYPPPELPSDAEEDGGPHPFSPLSDEEILDQQQPLQRDDSHLPARTTTGDLFHALHTRHLTWKEMARALLTIQFITHFSMFAVFGWAFYGLIYVTVPFVSSMGAVGTVYAHVTPISTSTASTVFTFWGVFQIIGSILVGGLASCTADAFAYCICAAVGGIATALLVFCRGYAAFAACLSVVGFCTAGIFAMMPALIAKDFHGPNIGFFMGAVFVAGTLGGFSAPPIQAQLQTQYDGNYSYGCVFISCCMTFPGVLCYLFLWPEKRSKLGRRLKVLLHQK